MSQRKLLRYLLRLETLDLYVDGADEITNDLNVLKGRGYDLVKEKILAQSADKLIIIYQ